MFALFLVLEAVNSLDLLPQQEVHFVIVKLTNRTFHIAWSTNMWIAVSQVSDIAPYV